MRASAPGSSAIDHIHAMFPEKVEVRVMPALATLTAMEQAGEAGFDLVFIDADKDRYTAYLPKAVALARTGGLILADNTLRDEVFDPNGDSGTKR